MTEEKSSYRQIFKSTSLFGGVQFFNILVSVVRVKFVAVLLGSSGVGILSLLQSSTSLIGTLTKMGLDVSAVRSISAANGTGDHPHVIRVITVFKRWVWISGILGALVTLILAPWLSQWTFGSSDYTFAYVWLSVTLLLDALSSGQITLLHGLQKLKQMAKANLIGTAIGVGFSIPIYYIYGAKGIVPTLVISSALSLIISWFYTKSINIEKLNISIRETFTEGSDMIKLGVLMTMSAFVNLFASYLVNAFISHSGSVSDVGLFQAAGGLTDKYVGLVFTAMVTDYFPRLSRVNKDTVQMNEVLNQQAELALLILCPILILLLSTTPLVIHILYTKEFLPIVSFIQWSIFSVLLKAGSWSLGFIFVAKGDSILFFWKELLGSLIVLSSNVIGYHLYGLEGLGISTTIGGLLILIFTSWLCYKKYKLSLEKKFRKILLIQIFICLIAFLFAYNLGFPYAYISGAVLFGIAGVYSFVELDKRIMIKQFVLSKLKK